MTETKAELRRQRDDARALAVRLEQEVAALKTGCHRVGWGYGHFRGGDPRMFRPDPEASDPTERERWGRWCDYFDRNEALPITVPPEQEESSFGLGIQVECLPDDRTIERLAAAEALAHLVAEREWSCTRFRGNAGVPACPSCYRSQEEGHGPKCKLGPLLDAWRATL